MRVFLWIILSATTLSATAQSAESELLFDFPGAKIIYISQDTVYSPFRELWKLGIYANDVHNIFAKGLDKIDFNSPTANIHTNSVLEFTENIYDSIATVYDRLQSQYHNLQRQDNISLDKHHTRSIIDFEYSGESYKQIYFQQIGNKRNIHSAAELDDAHKNARELILSLCNSLITIRDAYERRVQQQLENLKRK